MITTVDLTDLVHHDRGTRARAAEAIRDGLAACGVVYVAGHGVELALWERMRARFLAFVDRPRAVKEACLRTDLFLERGWTPDDEYTAAPLPLDADCAAAYPQIYAPNVWPEGDADFADDFVALGQQLHEAALGVMQGLSIALGLPPRGFDQRVEGAPSVLRLSRGRMREAPTDLLALLPDAGSIAARAGDEEIALEPPEGCLVARAGQPLEILTGGRVRAASLADAGGVRAVHSLVLHAHQMIFPFERFRTLESIRRYAPAVLAVTYAHETLAAAGLAPPAPLGYRA